MSYTKSDSGWAEWIAWQLEEAKFTVLLQAWDMVPGSNWLRMMNQATRFAERTVAVVSKAYLDDSAFGEAEWLAAYRRDPEGLAGRVIPIRVEECAVEGLLGGIVYADLVGIADNAAAREAVLAAVLAAIARRSKPLMEPDFPGANMSTDDAAGPAALEITPRSQAPRGVGLAGPSMRVDRSVAVGTAPEGGVAATTSGGSIPTVGAGSLARSDYLAQVRQIAPRRLLGRDTELAAMTAFCTDTATGRYLWWRATAWTGKSALMSTFLP